ncbi:MAG: peptide-methionine (S)-S-oxide reductase MsrA [Geminicoccaceae bacterium]
MRAIIGAALLLLALGSSQARATEYAILAGGCFWCVESDMDAVPGVLETQSGYIGGKFDNPTYESHSAAGDLEAVKVTFDPAIVTYRQLLDIFWRTIDVTDDGGQFCDRGNSYRTAVFVANAGERAIAEESKAAAEQALGQEIVTRILDAPTFWPAEDYHQDFHTENPLRYTYYRYSCGRNRQVERVWGDQAYQGLAE